MNCWNYFFDFDFSTSENWNQTVIIVIMCVYLFTFFPSRLVHHNYVGIDSEKNPYFLSVVMHDTGSRGTPLYRAILFRKQVKINNNHLYLFIKYRLIDHNHSELC